MAKWKAAMEEREQTPPGGDSAEGAPHRTAEPGRASASPAGSGCAPAGDPCACAPVPEGPWLEEPGAVIGRYKLLQRIGDGGFGVVYMAEQREPVRRKVALKLIKPGMDTEQVIARFEAERQALAMMDHSNIAKVFDAGTTRQGRPYFVMELVKGVPITTYCDTENLTTRQRLELFIDVCRAVQHAHQKGIIHRDLKPSNVLVTLHDGRPVPKVIDFGIAKATNAELTERTLFTEFRQFIGTPEYMSPEQAEMSGLDIDTRSDIYSLGVLLYELLTGTTPFEGQRLRSAALDEIQRIIREEEPPRPSTRISSLIEMPSRTGEERWLGASTSAKASAEDIARHRRTDPRHLSRQLRGDLDWIIMKTLEKDRTRRYETASSLADDVERHLGQQPVLAGPPSAGYRLSKFYRRNRGRVVAAAAVAAMFLLGLAGTTAGMLEAWTKAREADNERKRTAAALAAEEEARQETEAALTDATEAAEIAEAVNDFLNEDLLAAVSPEEMGRDVTVLEALERAASVIEARFADQPPVLATLHHTIGKSYTALGRYEEARRHIERSLQLRQEHLASDRQELIAVRGTLGALHLYLGRYADAERVYVPLLSDARQSLGEDAATTLGIANNLCVAYMGQGKHAAADALLRQSLETAERSLGKDHLHTISVLGSLANLQHTMGRYDEAQGLFEETLSRQERTLGTDHVSTLLTHANLAMIYRATGQPDLAEKTLLHVLDQRRRLLGDQHQDTIATLTNLGVVYRATGRLADAEAVLREAVDSGRRSLGSDHPDLLIAMAYLGDVYRRMPNPEAGEPLLKEALAGLERALGPAHTETLSARSNLVEFYREQGRNDEIERVATEQIRLLKLAAASPEATADTLNNAAHELIYVEPTRLRDPSLAVELARRACNLTGGREPYYLDTLACALAAAGDAKQAMEVIDQALAITPSSDAGRVEMLAHRTQFGTALGELPATPEGGPTTRPVATPGQ